MPLRVAILLQHWILGGAERQAIHVARALQARGHHMELWSLEGARPGAAPVLERAHAEGLTTVEAGHGRSAVTRVFAVSARLRTSHIDVVLPFTVTPNLVAAASWQLGGARGTVWNQRDAHLDLGMARKAVARRVRLFVANSASVAAALPLALGVDPERVLFIPNVVEAPQAGAQRADWRARLRIPDDALVVTALARLHPGKRLDLAIRALASCRAEPFLVLAGVDQGAGDALRALAAELGVGARVRFAGHIDDVGGLLAASDAGIFTSGPVAASWHGEGTSNAVLETVAAGLPCACTDDPAIREIVDAAWIAPAAPGALARVLDTVLSASDVRSVAALRGVELCQRFSPAAVAPLWESVLQQAAGAVA